MRRNAVREWIEKHMPDTGSRRHRSSARLEYVIRQETFSDDNDTDRTIFGGCLASLTLPARSTLCMGSNPMLFGSLGAALVGPSARALRQPEFYKSRPNQLKSL